MSKKSLVIIFTLIFAVVAITGISNSQGKYQWKLEKTKDGCQVYTSKVAGKEYLASKCTCVIDAPMDVIGMVIRDIPNYPAWMTDCSATKVLKTISEQDDKFVFWLHQHIPLLTDRDVVIKNNTILNYNKGYAIIEATSTTEMNYPEQPKLVRMPSFSAVYTLEWIDKTHSKVTFLIDPDLGKGLPIGLSNSIITDNPWKSLAGMKKMVKQSKYIEGAKTSKYRKLIDDAVKNGYVK
jgi:hypothetical protein